MKPTKKEVSRVMSALARKGGATWTPARAEALKKARAVELLRREQKRKDKPVAIA